MTNPSSLESAWSDESLPTTDIAGRTEFAHAVATRIDRCAEGQASTVFGVVGPWGIGKTTLLKDIVGRLGHWTCVWFSPWSVADVESITTEFVSALSGAFPQSPTMKEKLAWYARLCTPALKLIPLVGDAAATVAQQAISELAKRPAWHSAFGTLSAEIADQHHRVLMVVDDVDRLDSDELRSLLRVVRLLGRFTNVHYLLAYDQATIDRVLESHSANGESSEFMEKIVQFPFEVPPTPIVVRRRWSRSIVDAVSPDDEASGGYSEQREQLVSILASGLETPRAAERLREQMLSLAKLISQAEVDALDFTALTWLRITHHQVWDEIRLHPDEYLSWRESDTDASRDMRMKRIKKLVRRGSAKPVQDAVAYMFEPMGVVETLAGRRWRIQSSRYFERYFHVGLADDDVSERTTESALRELANGRANSEDACQLEAIIVGQDEERSALALDVIDKLRRDSPGTSLAILDYVEKVRLEFQSIPNLHPFRRSAVDRWLVKEIFRALETRLVSEGELVSRFGYGLITASAYAAKRSLSHDDSHVKDLYSGVAQRWVNEVLSEPLATTLARDELLSMTSFCSWIQDIDDLEGFLADRVSDKSALVDAASRYVSFNEWVGSSVEYDIVFREKEFRFAVGSAMTASMQSQLPQVSDLPDYDISDRPTPDLTETQRRDFAIRSLGALTLT